MGRVHGWFLPPLRGGGERRGRAPRPGARHRGASGAGVARLELTVALTENSVKSGGSVNHRGRKGCSRGLTRGGRRLVRLTPHPGRGAVGCPQSAFIRTGRRSPRVIASYGQPLGPAQPFRAGPSTEEHTTADPGEGRLEPIRARPRREPRHGRRTGARPTREFQRRRRWRTAQAPRAPAGSVAPGSLPRVTADQRAGMRPRRGATRGRSEDTPARTRRGGNDTSPAPRTPPPGREVRRHTPRRAANSTSTASLRSVRAWSTARPPLSQRMLRPSRRAVSRSAAEASAAAGAIGYT